MAQIDGRSYCDKCHMKMDLAGPHYRDSARLLCQSCSPKREWWNEDTTVFTVGMLVAPVVSVAPVGLLLAFAAAKEMIGGLLLVSAVIMIAVAIAVFSLLWQYRKLRVEQAYQAWKAGLSLKKGER